MIEKKLCIFAETKILDDSRFFFYIVFIKTMMNIKCNRCKIEKSCDNFYKRKLNKSGYNNQCKKCGSDYLKFIRKKNNIYDKNSFESELYDYFCCFQVHVQQEEIYRAAQELKDNPSLSCIDEIQSRLGLKFENYLYDLRESRYFD